MKEAKGIIIAVIIGISAIICTYLGVTSLMKYKKTQSSGGVTATGSASCDFVSDLIVWRGSFSAEAPNTKDAYAKIKKDAQSIKEYLIANGVKEDEIVFSSVNIWQNSIPQYNDSGEYVGDVKGDYSLNQEVEVRSADVEKIEKISRDISALIDSGVNFSSFAPEYYYTKLDELKLKLIEEATENAKARIDLIASGSGAQTGELLNANLGVFQITAQNSAEDGYSSGGTYNTSSKNKTATITVRLNYATK